MLDIFNLNSYKDYLISYYFYNCDNTEEKRLERQKILENRYSDEYLQNIVENTKEFAFSLLENISGNFISIELPKEEEYIFTNCTGGYFPDILIAIDSIDEEKRISKYLLDRFLGNNFKTYFDTAETEVFDDENEDFIIGCIYETPKFVIIGNFKEKLATLRKEKQEELVRILKRATLKMED